MFKYVRFPIYSGFNELQTFLGRSPLLMFGLIHGDSWFAGTGILSFPGCTMPVLCGYVRVQSLLVSPFPFDICCP